MVPMRWSAGQSLFWHPSRFGWSKVTREQSE